ncbi:MAG: Addiction module antitoxin, RelB/DinJ family [Microgenomates group bacterium GW2011_GWA1_48_10]|uniref:Uncharacterized protein n=1 Tax=Candidatus Gottesmanbacteria bacterium RIFCSPHIGHO2_01_FULL_47_48 TaxID=1798381 RepID=A0A1F6A5M5_9BACT|nr:MAG: Addiction module antitoxin, RelB/DinJ family [Microgenomates group bacterium GW2011_GWA1_48_10]OGG19784.1 MAG: hypothetical protein A2721_01270 [Candidatus Gottesmanbacteria bacterium RIFCSPHIGHO2_01_FULL_47_48]
MNTAAIYIKTQPEVKKQAQEVARQMGLSLSALVNGWLRQLVKTKTVTFKAEQTEIPNARFRRILRQADKDWKAGKGSPMFDNADDAIAYLEKIGI